MVPHVQFARSGLKTSRLGFGTSRLHYIDTPGRQRLLAEAAALGISHFDTAPSYGDGLAEREVGQFLRGRRDRFVIATKYGIPPDPVIAAVPQLSGTLRGVRAVARCAGFWDTKRPPLTAAGLRQSVEHSLQRLVTDWIDVLLLHEASRERVPDPASILQELTNLRARGLIRHFGLAGAWSGISGLGDMGRQIGQIVQTDEAEWPQESPPDITYGAISMTRQTAFAGKVEADAALTRLSVALARRPNGTVIVSTTKCENLRRLAAIAAVPAD